MGKKIFLLIIVLYSFASCNKNLVHTEFKATQGGNWAKDNTIQFTFSGLDSINTHNMFINIRNDNTFPYSNLFLIAELDFPNGETQKDTLEYEMALPDGSWLGKGYGSIKENKLWYKENIVFSENGVYTLTLSHAMRKNGAVNGVIDLEGITDVGFQIEKTEK